MCSLFTRTVYSHKKQVLTFAKSVHWSTSDLWHQLNRILRTRQSSSGEAVIGLHRWAFTLGTVGWKGASWIAETDASAHKRSQISISRGFESTFWLAAGMPYMLISTQIRLVRMLHAPPSSLNKRNALQRNAERKFDYCAAGSCYSWPRGCHCAHRNKTTTAEASSEERICWRCILCLSRCPEFKPHVGPLSPSGCARWFRQRLILDCLVIRDYDPHLPQGC